MRHEATQRTSDAYALDNVSGGALDASAKFDGSLLPIVSVIIINFNYASHVTDAVASVSAQTYRNVECVVVDDASTDGSQTLLQRLGEQHPRIRIIQRARNGGQMVAAMEGIAATTGTFVHFLDADDYLHPTFIETHVAVHLSLRSPAGFTCCDMVYLYRGAALTTCDSNISRYLHSRRRQEAPQRNLEDEATAGLGLRSVPPGRVFTVRPSNREWPWAATSAVVFRRDALDLFSRARGLSDIRRSLDGYFCRGVNAVAGSVLIDMPLVVYRLHGSNAHLARPPLNHTIKFDRARERSTTEFIVDRLLQHVIADCASFRQLYWDTRGYWTLLANLAAYRSDRRLAAKLLLIKNFSHLRQTFGFWQLAVWICGIKLR